MEREAVVQRGRAIIERLSPDYRVLNGPFRGLQYPHIQLQRSSLPARIIGSYEQQLHPFIEQVVGNDYAYILDIGSAEGYYAAGLAVRKPDTTVHCYDTDLPSMDFCRQMARCNGLSNLTYNGFCTKDTLRQHARRGRGFIFSDCEGYELELFSLDMAAVLHQCDLLIELHEIFRPGLSEEIMRRFQATHWIERIDNSRQDVDGLEGLSMLSPEDAAFALCEHRGGFGRELRMEWIFLTAKSG